MKRIALTIAVIFIHLVVVGCTANSTRTGEEMGGLSHDQKGPSPADVYVKMAVAYLQQGQVAVALTKIKRGLELDPTSADAHNIIALIYERLGELSLAEQHYEQALNLNSHDPYILNAYGSFLCTQKRYSEANQHFMAALRNSLYPTPEVALTNAGICADLQLDHEQAETYYRQALRANAKFPTALQRMAKISFKKQNYLSARGYLQRYLEVAQHTAETLWLGIRIERKLGDLDTLASYEMLLRAKFPDSEEMRAFEDSSKK